MTVRVSPEQITAFAATLPRRYSERHDARTVALHASLAEARAGAPAVVGTFGRAGNAICVVAADRPGLLSLIAASLALSSLDVSQAEAYTRTSPGGGREAVDLFWVRKLDAPPGAALVQADAERVQQHLVRFLAGEADPAAEMARLAAGFVQGARSADATVRFGGDDAGGLATLEVEMTDRAGLLFSLSRALFTQRVQILESEVRTVDGRVFDRFRVAELDGTAVTSARRLEIQVSILSALEPARRSAPPPRG